MNMIRNKLKEKDGVSILMGLLYLLVCLMVGTVVLVASTAAAGKLAGQQKSEQDYLTVASAARLVKDRICKLTYTYTVTYKKTDSKPEDTGKLKVSDSSDLPGSPDPVSDPADNQVILKDSLTDLCDILANNMNSDSPSDSDALNNKLKLHTTSFQIKYDITGASDDMKWEIVYGSVSMKVDGRIIVELWLGDPSEDKGTNHMTIEFCPDGPVKQTETKNEEASGVITSTVTDTITCSWPENGCTITRGRGEP